MIMEINVRKNDYSKKWEKLLSSESIIKIGGGRYTKYVWNRDKE